MRSFLQCQQAKVSSSWKCFICCIKFSLFLSRSSRMRFFSFSRLRSNSSSISQSCIYAVVEGLGRGVSLARSVQFLRRIIVKVRYNLTRQYTKLEFVSYSGLRLYQIDRQRRYRQMKNSHFNPRKERFKEAFEDSSANFSELEKAVMNNETEGRPIQLIRIRPTGKIEINNEALDIIASYNQPVGFVSLVGKTRTGKSCLLNRLLNIKGQGFRVDPSTSSCTEGIWMWSTPFQNHKYNNLIFFLDTEGTDSLVKDAENDTKIFTLAVLISTYFIYNSVGSIDERSISEIEMVTALSKKIRSGEDYQSNDPSQIARFMPKFLWLLRDFMLQIEDRYNKRISPNTYLENCLRDQDTIGKVNQTSKKIKKTIISYFPMRECLTLVRPVDEQQMLYDLNILDDHRLRRQFIEGVNTLRNKIIDNTGPKIYGGADITGYGMSVMIQNYVDAFNSGGVPNIKSAWEQIAADEGNEAYNKALEAYEGLFQQELGDQRPHGEQIYKIVGKLRLETMNKFKEEAGTNHKEHRVQQIKLEEFIDRNQQEILDENNRLCTQHNNNLIFNYSLKIRKRIEENFYANAEGKTNLANDLEEVKNNYMKESVGKNSGEVLAEFLSAITPLLASINTQNQAEKAALQRQQEIAEEEQRRRMKLQQQQNESLKVQKEAQNRGDTIKAGTKMKRQTSKEKKQTQGCCSGGCIIM